MPRRIDTLTAAATALHTPLSPQPLTHYAPGTEVLADQLYIDYDHITEYMSDYGLEKPDLAHLLVSVHPHGTLPRTSRNARACLYTVPQMHQGSIYYPHIGLGTSVTNPNLADLNDSLRHELWHVTQEDTVLLYNQPRTVRIVQGIGLAALAGATAAGVEASTSHAAALYIISGGAALLGAVSLTSPDSLLSYASTQEVEARQFAHEHQDFQPISFAS